ncbi:MULTISPECIES: TonB-dependent receptor domain-containing protein [Sphingomonas]|nr:TonB-dependent receptor [Sphingomonas sp. CGMCC 1.13658]
MGRKTLAPAMAALLGSSMLAAPAIGQDQTAQAPQQAATGGNAAIGDIIVTAQKREESLQNVPISVQAMGTQKLEQLNISDFNDYTKLLPSVAFQTIVPGATTVYIRGVASGGDGNHSGSLPSVGFYLDEQPITTIGGTLDVHIYDIARIEALSGPQGTLYGASSEAGTVRIITNKPSTAGFEGGFDVEGNTVRKGGQGGKIEGFVNVPLSESVAIRAVGFYQHDAGYIDNIAGTRTFIAGGDPDAPVVDPNGLSISNPGLVEKNYNDVDTYGGRLALGIDLSDDWTATASVFGQDQKAHGSFGYDTSLGDLKVQRFFPEINHDRWVQAALTVQGKIGSWDLTYAGAYLDRKRNSKTDYVDYAEAYDQLYANYALYDDDGAITGYLHGLAQVFYYQDNAGNTILPLQHIDGSDHFKRISQELRIASPAEEPFRIVGGVFYQRQSNLIHQDYKIDNLGADVSVNGFPGTLWLTQQKRVDRDYAIFGEASWDVTPTVTLTGGLRGYKFDNTLIGFFGFGRNPNADPADGRPFTATPFNAAASSRTGVAGCYTADGRTLREVINGSTDTVTLLPPTVRGSPCTDLADFKGGKLVPKRTKDTGVLYRANVTWKPAEGKLLYATWSKGFRPGGINRRGTIPPYAPDFLVNYEVGFKTTWNNVFRWNGAFFWQDWKKFQFSFLGENSFTEIHNGPNARIKGVETDFAWNPVTGLTLSGSAAYTDGKIRRNLCQFDDPTFTCLQGGVAMIASPKGTRLPITPRFKFTATGRYEFEAGPELKPYLQATVTHASSASSDIRQNAGGPNGFVFNPALQLGRLPAWTTADFAIGAKWQRFTTELFIQNAFDERAQISRFVNCGSCYPAAGGFAGFSRSYAVVQTPRTIGVRAGYRF